MPGYDGTGPRGLGPMTGGGGGFCVLKLPGASDEPLAGFVGWAGYPVRVWSHGMGTVLESLQVRIWNVATGVRRTHRRIAALEATLTETGNIGP